MRKQINVKSGDTFGEWTVVEMIEGVRPMKYRCKCTCGTERIILKSSLAYGKTLHCGCKYQDLDSPYHSKRIPDLRGQHLGRLTPMDYVDVNGKKKWHCRCDCGKEVFVATAQLRDGSVVSCGCYLAEAGRINSKKAQIKNTVAYDTDVAKIKAALEGKPARSATGIRGVTQNGNRFRALITFKREVIILGYFDTAQEAAKARKEAEQKLYAPFLEWYEREGKFLYEEEQKQKMEEIQKEAIRLFKNSPNKRTREKYAKQG